MSEKNYRELVREYRRKDRLYPNRGRSVRPWEWPLKDAIVAELMDGLRRGSKWAREEVQFWWEELMLRGLSREAENLLQRGQGS